MKITHYTLPADIPASLTIAHVSDLHDRPPHHVLEALRATPPSLIAITGDLFDRWAEAQYARLFLTEAATIAPTFYAPGNHERLGNGDVAAISACGVTFLQDEAVPFEALTIGGVRSGFGQQKQGNLKNTPAPNLPFLDRFAAMDGYKVLLCHHPEYFPEYIRPHTIPLTLSGHAHGGQWQLCGRGLFAPGQGLFPTYTSGVYEGRLIVSRGLSNTTLFPRFGNPTELVYIHLYPRS